MKKIINFMDAFVKRITKMVKPYDEESIIFDCYDIAQSLKQKMRTKRAHGKEMVFAIHDEVDITKITLKELLSGSMTKALMSNVLGNALLEEYEGSKKKVLVMKGTAVQINHPHSMAESMFTHNHEEADTMIRLHAIDAIGDSTLRDIDVWSPDTDVLILLGKFVGISKKSCITSYLPLPNDEPIVSAFQFLGEGVLTSHELAAQRSDAHGEVCLISIQLWRVQLPYQLCVGNYSGPGIWRAHQHCVYEGQKLYHTSPMLTDPRGKWMAACRG